MEMIVMLVMMVMMTTIWVEMDMMVLMFASISS